MMKPKNTKAMPIVRPIVRPIARACDPIEQPVDLAAELANLNARFERHGVDIKATVDESLSAGNKPTN